MAQFTLYDDGSIAVKAYTTDELVIEFEKLVKSGKFFKNDTVTLPTIYSNFSRVHLDVSPANFVTTSDFVEYDSKAKLITRDSNSFFKELEKRIHAGYTYVTGTVVMAQGAYSCELNTVAKPVHQSYEQFEEAIPAVEEFCLEKALNLDDKMGLVDYCAKYGIELDKRQSISKMKNVLRTKVQ